MKSQIKVKLEWRPGSRRQMGQNPENEHTQLEIHEFKAWKEPRCHMISSLFYRWRNPNSNWVKQGAPLAQSSSYPRTHGSMSKRPVLRIFDTLSSVSTKSQQTGKQKSQRDWKKKKISGPQICGLTPKEYDFILFSDLPLSIANIYGLITLSHPLAWLSG